MALTGLDPTATRSLATAMQRASDDVDALAADLGVALRLCELDSDAPGQLTMESIELEKVGLVLHARADLVDGYVIDIQTLARQLEIPAAQITAAVNAISGPDFDEAAADPLLTLVAEDNFLYDDPPQSIRDVLFGLPPEGADPALDAALDRVKDLLLASLLSGSRLDHDNLTGRQRADMKLVAIALGGDRITEPRTEYENVHIEAGENELRAKTVYYTIIECGDDDILDFVQTQMENQFARRRASAKLLAATSQIDRDNLEAEAARLGVSGEELQVVLATADLVAAGRSVGGDGGGGEESVEAGIGDGDATRGVGDGSHLTDENVPRRDDFPAGPKGDEDYINAVEQDRLDRVNAGINVVGPVGKEQTAFYEAMGSLFGAQNLGFTHDYQATMAEIQNRNDPGFLGVDLPNAVTATIGYAAAVTTAPVIGAINSVFGTEIDVAVIGSAIAELGWSAFGYDVTGPTIAESRAKAAADAKAKKEAEDLQQRRDDFDNSSDRRDNLAKEGHDPSIRDDDFSGDQNTGGNGLL